MAAFSGANIVTLAQVRSYLRFPSAFTQDDSILSTIIIPAADQAMRRECGDTLAKQFDEYYDGGDYAIYTRNTPILNVDLVEEGWGWTNYTLNYIQVNSIPVANQPNDSGLFAYSVDIPETGKISRRYGGNVPAPFVPGEANIHVIYTAGRTEIPEIIQLAELELIAHWYRNALQRAGANSSAYSYDSVNEDFPHSGNDIYTSINQGVPYRILEMIKAYRRGPIIG